MYTEPANQSRLQHKGTKGKSHENMVSNKDILYGGNSDNGSSEDLRKWVHKRKTSLRRENKRDSHQLPTKSAQHKRTTARAKQTCQVSMGNAESDTYRL